MSIIRFFEDLNNRIEAESKKIWEEAQKGPFSIEAQLKAKKILRAKFSELGPKRRDQIVRDIMADLSDRGQATDDNLIKQTNCLCYPDWHYGQRVAA